jgi:hypothetical protein
MHLGGLAPGTEQNAKAWLHRSIPGFDRYLANGQIEILRGPEWYLKGEEFDLQRITGGWSSKLRTALAKGYSGMRVSGNAFWIEGNYWKEFCEYEHELARSLAGQKMIVLYTYSLRACRAVDLMGCSESTSAFDRATEGRVGIPGNARSQAGQAGYIGQCCDPRRAQCVIPIPTKTGLDRANFSHDYH